MGSDSVQRTFSQGIADLLRCRSTLAVLHSQLPTSVGSALRRALAYRCCFGTAGRATLLLLLLMVLTTLPVLARVCCPEFAAKACYLTAPRYGRLHSGRDPWGRKFRFATLTGRVYSLGPDGLDEAGSGDDISLAAIGVATVNGDTIRWPCGHPWCKTNLGVVALTGFRGLLAGVGLSLLVGELLLLCLHNAPVRRRRVAVLLWVGASCGWLVLADCSPAQPEFSWGAIARVLLTKMPFPVLIGPRSVLCGAALLLGFLWSRLVPSCPRSQPVENEAQLPPPDAPEGDAGAAR